MLPIGDNSCHQGTLMATLLYIIYVLDQPYVAHIDCTKNEKESNESICMKNMSSNYVDDNNSEITSDNWINLENDAEKCLINQKNIMTIINCV